jgi:hypothetical protein
MPRIERMMMLRRLVRFLADVLISAVISGSLSMMIWGLFGSLGSGWGLLLMLLPLQLVFWILVYGPFVLLPVYGLKRSRWGFVAGPVMLGVAAYVFSTMVLKQADAEIAALIPQGAEPVWTDYAILATDGGSTGCDDTCMKILATSGYALARTNEHLKDHRWRLYRVASGQVCFATDNAALALEFLRHGYPGKCAVAETVADFGDGLILRTRTVDTHRPAPDLPKGFEGTAYEFSERSSGRTTLMARRMVGVMAEPLPQPLMIFGAKQQRFDMGPPIDEKQFLANALKIPVDDLFKRPQPFPFEEVLDEIEKYFDRKEIVERFRTRSIEGFAENAWQGVISSEGRGHTDELLRRITRLLASDDPIRVTAAVHGLSNLDSEQQVFADDRVLELAFVAMPADATSAIHALLKSRLSRGGLSVPDGLRERARSRLDDPDVTAAQRQVLMLIRGS